MKRLALFVGVGVALFMLAFVATNPATFFGGPRMPSEREASSRKPEVEGALTRYAQAMSAFYSTGDERPARLALAAPDAPDSPLHDWRLDRELYLAQGVAPKIQLTARQLDGIIVGPGTVTATARETWEIARLGEPALRSELTVRYTLRDSGGELRVAEEALQP